jgi:hypothetical protein
MPQQRYLFLLFFIAFLQIHLEPVKVMKYNPVFDTVISVDAKGLIEYWSPTTLKFPESEYVHLYRCDVILIVQNIYTSLGGNHSLGVTL